MRILLTGGTGMIGRPLAYQLRQAGHEVWLLGRSSMAGTRDHLYIRADIGEYRHLDRVMRQTPFEMVYHLAAEVGRHNGEQYYESMWRTNVVGTKNLIRLQEAYGYRLVMFSSAEVYGNWEGEATEEITSTYPIRQSNDYALSKWVNELQVSNSIREHGTQSVIVRPFNIYGPGEVYTEYRSAICTFIYCALHAMPYTVFLNHHRSSLYIDDACRTLTAIAQNFKAGAVYNIASRSRYDMKTISDTILRQCGKDDHLVRYIETEDQRPNRLASIVKSEADLEHKEVVPLEEGIARTVAWQRAYYSIG